MHRFSRTELLLGPHALSRIQAANVAVFGLGAVGSYAVEALARAGIGSLRLVDFDTVRLSNINRQLYALDTTLDRPKIDVAIERVRAINPECRIDARAEFVDGKTVGGLLSPRVDFVVDAIDSLSSKVILIRSTLETGIPLISSMGAAARLDPLAIRIGDISETYNCPLAKLIRKRLHRVGVRSGFRCVYSEEPARTPAVAVKPEADAFHRGRARVPVGSMSYITGIFGLTMASEVIRSILGDTDRNQ